MSQDFLPGAISLAPAEEPAKVAVDMQIRTKIREKLREISFPGFQPALADQREAPVIMSVDALRGQGIFTAEFFRSLQMEDAIGRMNNTVDVKIHTVCPAGKIDYTLAVIYIREYLDAQNSVTIPFYYLFGEETSSGKGLVLGRAPLPQVIKDEDVEILAYRGRLIVKNKGSADRFVPWGWQGSNGAEEILGGEIPPVREIPLVREFPLVREIPLLPLILKEIHILCRTRYFCDATTDPETLLVAASKFTEEGFSLFRYGRWVETEEGEAPEILLETEVDFLNTGRFYFLPSCFTISVDWYGKIFVLCSKTVVLLSPDFQKLAEYTDPEIQPNDIFNPHLLINSTCLYPYRDSVVLSYKSREPLLSQKYFKVEYLGK